MKIENVESCLNESGVSPTPNRLLVLRAIAESTLPQSLSEIEATLETLEKSSISRVLNLLETRGVIHAVQDGRGGTKYEICHAAGHNHSQFDMHTHFYCTRCRRTFCFEDIAVPQVNVPEGFRTESVNYMLKGVCPECIKHQRP